MTNWFTSLLDRIFAVIGVIVCVQAPLFIQQYTLQLSGRVAELRLQADAMVQAASQGNKSTQQFIQRFMDSGDPDFMRQGEVMSWTLERYTKFSSSFEALTSATLVSKPFVFVRHFNGEVVRATLGEFQPGLLLTLEGLIYGIMGFAIGCGAFLLLKWGANLCRHFIFYRQGNVH